MRLYGLRQWVEQGYKQVKQELGWGDFQVRSDRAIRRHWALVCCAFCFCWWAQSQHTARGAPRDRNAAHPATTAFPLPLAQEPGVGEKWDAAGSSGFLTVRAHWLLHTAVLASRAAAGAGLA